MRLLSVSGRLRPLYAVRLRPPFVRQSNAIVRLNPQCSHFAMASTLGPDWSRRTDGSTPYSIYGNPIVKSQQDDREYQLIQLDNGLQAMLVHDAKADKAAASLDVAVGHLNDPDDMPGLAHFCEHLLFMGTELYPKENEYSEYLAKNNGHSNAYTSTTNTNYFFDVSTGALSGALSRFAAFFHCPLFSPSCTLRELNAVDSEHKKNHQADLWRIFQVKKHVSKEGHPYRKFGSGNRQSLTQAGKDMKAKVLMNENGGTSLAPPSPSDSLAPTRNPSPSPSTNSASSEQEADGGHVGRETRRRLIEWWSKEYCASRMRLCVIGKESLDDLAALVAERFSPILKRGDDPLPMITDHPFGPQQKGVMISVQTIMNLHVAELSFPLPYQPPYWRHKPGQFLAHFVGHEGPGSVYTYLKSKGWVVALTAASENLARGFGMFKVVLYLTEEGFKHNREAFLAVHKYISLLRSSSFPSWYQHEISVINSTRFRFQEKRRPDIYAVWVSETMAWPSPRDLVLAAPQLVWDWDDHGEKEMREMLDGLRADNGWAMLNAKADDHAKLKDVSDWEAEPWYGTPYRIEKWDEEFMKEAQGPNDIPELFLPGPNEFLPTNLDVDKRVVDQPSKRPHLIRETALSSLWHKKDDQFWVPKAYVLAEILSPVANISARNSVMTRLFADLVNDALSEFAYDADLAGLVYSFGAQSLGLSITFSGYNDKLHVLGQHVLEKAKNLQVAGDRLEVVKQQLQRDWKNFFLGQPYTISDYYTRYLMADQQWTLQEKLTEIQSITPAEIQKHITELLSKVHVRMLVVGNIHKEEAVRLVQMTEQILQSSPVPSSDVVDKSFIPSDCTNHVWSMPVPNPNEPNSSLAYYVHFGSLLDSHIRVTASLLTQILSEPAFNILRTREQLGYIVFCSQMSSVCSSQVGLRIAIQSERTAAYLEERVEAFLEEMQERITQMTQEEFDAQKAGLERRWKEGVKNMREEANRFWVHISNGYLDFLRRDNDVELLETISKDDVLALFLSRVQPSSPTRAKVSVHLNSRKPRPKKISALAMNAFEELLLKRTHLDPQEGKETLSKTDDLTVDNFTKYWQDKLADPSSGVAPNVAQEFLQAIPGFLADFPVDGEYEGKIKEGVVMIDNPKTYKTSLMLSAPPKPLIEWGDLPVSKI